MALELEDYVMWGGVVAAAGFVGWRIYQAHQVASDLPAYLPAPAAPITAPPPLLAPPVNLMNPPITTPPPATTTTPPPATAITNPPANDDASQNAAFASASISAAADQNRYYDQVQADVIARVQSGELVPGTQAYSDMVTGAANRHGVDHQAEELQRMIANGLPI